MIGRLLNRIFGPTAKRYYDITRPSRHMDNHFSGIDGSDADTLIESSLETARNRCRYEVRNNCYAKGIIDTLANDIVGTGPALQVQSESQEFDASVARRWEQWMAGCDAAARQGLEDMLRLAVMQLCESGEAIFSIGINTQANPSLPGLGLLMIEPDRVNTPYGYAGDTNVIQGIRVDRYGRPESYYIQTTHPGSTRLAAAIAYDTVPAEKVIHLAKIDRPGQTRGMPWLTPAMPLFAHLRRYTLSVVSAAEKAADLAAVMESDAPVGGAVDADEFETVDIERGSMLTLPAGWKMSQFKAEQPTDTYAMFKSEVINEIARCVNMPLNVATCNSSSYNYASGRLDWQTYFRNITVLRKWLEKRFLTRVFDLWYAEGRMIRGYFNGNSDINSVVWHWPGMEHVDPAKESAAQDTRLKNLSTTYAAEYARQGKDWQAEFEQIAREKKVMEELGISAADMQNQSQNNQSEENEDEEPEDQNRRRAVFRAG